MHSRSYIYQINPFLFDATRASNRSMARSRFPPRQLHASRWSQPSPSPACGLPEATGRTFFERLTTVAIGALFFLHGAKLSREAIVGGITHWRLQLLVFASTFVHVPGAGLRAQAAAVAAGHARALRRRAVPVRAAGDGAIGDRVHLDGAGQRGGGGLQRLGVHPARRVRDAAAGQSDGAAAGRGGRRRSTRSDASCCS